VPIGATKERREKGRRKREEGRVKDRRNVEEGRVKGRRKGDSVG
jgi:hypothetical protein